MSQEAYKAFAGADDYRAIMGAFENLCCTVGVDMSDRGRLYEQLKQGIQGYEARTLFDLLDKRLAHSVYEDKPCSGSKMLVVGAGPCGLRMAVEGAMLGCQVALVEMRDYFSRNNVAQIWEFMVKDLKLLGGKKFYPRLGLGEITHISIRRLQVMLLKIALLLGVQVYAPVEFKHLLEPPEATDGKGPGWRVELSERIPGVTDVDFDIIIGADGSRKSVPGFERTHFRGKRGIAISCNFVNYGTREEKLVKEIGGFAHIDQANTGEWTRAHVKRDIENIIYFKNETHYFIMTIQKQALIDMGILKSDCAISENILAEENIDREKLREYAKQIAHSSTQHKIPKLDFAKTHKGEDDVTIIDFTFMTQSTHTSLVTERRGKRLLRCLVGDSLQQPFWPSGTGCACGWMAVLDTAWMLQQYCRRSQPLEEILAEREALLTQLKFPSPLLLFKPNHEAHTLDPATRYKTVPRPLKPEAVHHIIDIQEPA